MCFHNSGIIDFYTGTYFRALKILDPSFLIAGCSTVLGTRSKSPESKLARLLLKILQKCNLPCHPQRFEPRVSPSRCGADLPTLLSGVPGVALPHRSHHCQPAAEHRALIWTHGRSPCVHQTPHALPGTLWRHA